MKQLNGKVAVITGGAQGMGAATVREFAANGAKVIIADVAAEAGNALQAELGEDAKYVHLDVSDESGWQSLRDTAIESFGRVDVLVNNAGIQYFAGVGDVEPEKILRVLSINVMGAMLGVKTLAPVMKASEGGVIVNISSLDGLRGVNGMSAYVASKWAVRGLTKAQALELGPVIRVVSVHPGGVNTAMGNPTGESEDELNLAYARVPLRRVGEPDEVAKVTAFLASDNASYISGAEIAVDGGWSAGHYHVGLPGGPIA